jgi:predicted secreted protein
MTCRRLARLAFLAVVISPVLAPAQPAPTPRNVINLSASADTELPNDWLTVVMTARVEGSDAAAVQAELKRLLDSALAESRPLAQPGLLELRTGGFSLSPRYDPKAQRTAGWIGQAQLIAEGRDAGAVAGLAGRLQSLTVSSAGWSLSRQARDAVEQEVTASAIRRFRAKADAVAQAFGYAAWQLREVSVGSESPQPYAAPRALSMAARADAGSPLPTEAGRTTVSVSVGGSVELSR